MATLGWMAGCWVISAFHADSSALAVYFAAAASLLVCLCAGFVPPQKSLRLAGQVSWRARAQALLNLMYNGIGSLMGYLACGCSGLFPGRLSRAESYARGQIGESINQNALNELLLG